MNLFEAFSIQEGLSFDTPDDLQSFLDSDIDNEEIQIVDVEAQNAKELRDSYIGNIILECPICSSKIFKPKSEVHKSTTDEDMFNENEDCPVCGCTTSFYVIGEIHPVSEDEPESTETTDSTDVITDVPTDTDVTTETTDDSVDSDLVKKLDDESEESTDEDTDKNDDEVDEAYSKSTSTSGKKTVGNLLINHKDEFNNCTSKEAIIEVLNSASDGLDTEASKYLETLKSNISKKKDYFSALKCIYDTILAGEGNRVIESVEDTEKIGEVDDETMDEIDSFEVDEYNESSDEVLTELFRAYDESIVSFKSNDFSCDSDGNCNITGTITKEDNSQSDITITCDHTQSSNDLEDIASCDLVPNFKITWSIVNDTLCISSIESDKIDLSVPNSEYSEPSTKE